METEKFLAETSASGPSLLPNNAKVRNKLLAPNKTQLLALKLNSPNGPKKQPKKVITPDEIFVYDGGPHFAYSVTSSFISRHLLGNWPKLWVAV
jgi:hypothetical protein